MIETVALQTSAMEWAAIGVLVTLLVAVGTALGAVVKIAYDASQELGVTLHGPDSEDSGGFIEQSKQRHAEMEEQHEQVYEQLLIQGRLLSELSYSFADIAEQMNDEDLDIDVDLERIRDLRERKDDGRWDDETRP